MANAVVNVKEKEEIDIFSKEALALPKRERIKLLLSAKSIPVTTKGTAIDKQIKEIINLHDFVNMIYVRIFPTEERDAEYLNFAFAKSFIKELEIPQINLMEVYETFDLINAKLENFAYEVLMKYPNKYDEYDLDEIFHFRSEKVEYFRKIYEEIGEKAFEREIMKYLE